MARFAYVKNGDVVVQLNRILPITAEIPTSGPDAFISDFLLSIGSESVLFMSCHDRNFRLKIDNIDARVFLWYSRFLGPFGNIVWRMLGSVKAFILLLKFRPDRILCGRLGGMLWISYLVSTLRSSPFVYSCHGSLSASKGIWYKKIFSALNEWTICRATAVVCHGPYLREQLIEIGVSSDKIFEFDVSFHDFMSEISYAHDIIDFEESSNCKYIVYVGRMEGDKGVFDLFDACAERLRKDSSIKLLYVGDGSKLNELQLRATLHEITGQIIFLGRVPHEMVCHIIRRGRVVVTPTRSRNQKDSIGEADEGRCLAAMESIFLGVPVIAPDSGPFPYLIKHGFNGLLFKTNSIDDLKKAIFRIIDDELLHSELCSGAQRTSTSLLNPPLSFSEAVQVAFSLSIRKKG